MTTKADELKTLIGEIGTGLGTVATNTEEIKGDLDEVLEKIEAINGLPTTAEWEEIKTSLSGVKTDVDALATSTREIADKVPEPPTPPPTI